MKVYLNILKESLRFALHALRVNRLRTFLSLLGVTIGIFAIVSVLTLVQSLENSIRGSIESLGDNVVFVQKWPWTFGSDYPWWKYINRPHPNLKELEFVKKKSKVSAASCLVIGTNADAEYKGNALEAIELIGVTHDYNRVKDLQLAKGRYFTDLESSGGKPYCIIGADIATVLFGETSPLHKTIEVKNQRMKVIGVFELEGSSFLGNSQDQQVYIPIAYAKKFTDITSPRVNPFLMVKAKPGVTNSELIDELTGILRAKRRLKPKADQTFALNQTSMLTNTFESVFVMLTFVGWILGGFSVLVGGFSIANIMFVSVKERTPVIGIQKSLGAKSSFILYQFLAESIFLCLLGGLLGLLLIFMGALLINTFTNFYVVFSLTNSVIGISISIAIGLVSGVLPALRAARMDPVEAIRAN